MKRISLKSILTVSALCMALTTVIGAIPASAEMPEYGKAEHHRQCEFGHSWKKTLTDDQKAQIERMHLTLKKDTSVLKAQLGVKKAELKGLLLKDTPDVKAIDQKMNEVTGLKKEIMQKRINHIIELRKILTPDQRVSFDSAIMNANRHRWGHRG